MTKATWLITALLAIGLTGAASAATIVFTGSESDFTSQGVSPLEDDDASGVDTQEFCGSGQHPLNISRVYVTDDATNIYIGIGYQRYCFCDMNLGVAFDTRPGGTASDPFGRQIDWSAAASSPDYVIYDVIPTSCNGFNYEVLYGTNGGGGWNTVVDGSNGLGIVDTDGGNFVEIEIELVQLSLVSCDPIRVEFWTTQEGNTKPAFDMVANDSQQRSSPSGTCFDVGPCPPSQPTNYLSYVLTCPTPVQSTTWGRIKDLYR